MSVKTILNMKKGYMNKNVEIYINDKEIACISLKDYNDTVEVLEKEIERLNKTINTALHRLRAGNRHYKTVQENNAIIYTIRILEEGLLNGSCSDIRK